MGISDGFRALNDEWAAFSYHKSHNKDQEEGGIGPRRARAHSSHDDERIDTSRKKRCSWCSVRR